MDGRRSVAGTESESEGGGDGGGDGVYGGHPHMGHPLHPNNSNAFQHPGYTNNPSYLPNHAPTVTFAPPFHPHPQALTTIRVTPVEGAAASSDGGSDCQSVASSSRESTLRRKSGTNQVSERGPTPDLHGHNNPHFSDDGSCHLDNESSNRFHENLRSFQENPIQPSFPHRQFQGAFGRPSPTPPPTLPRPILTHNPSPTLRLAYKE